MSLYIEYDKILKKYNKLILKYNKEINIDANSNKSKKIYKKLNYYFDLLSKQYNNLKCLQNENINTSKMCIGIVGGGISGLYCALELSKKYKVILFDERNYLGGRILTRNHLELGAARFNDTHLLLLSLIKRYNLTLTSIPKNQDYILYNETTINKTFKNVNIIFDLYMKYIINKTITDKKLEQISFYQHCENIIGPSKAKILLSIFGYYTEFKQLNAYDAIQTFKNDFVSKQYYILKEGLSELCNCMKEEIIKNGSKIYINEKVLNVEINKIITSKRQIKVDKIIFCTKAKQLNDFEILKPIHKYLNLLYEAPLLRIYAKYKNVWFKDLNRTTTNNVLRQIIPIDKVNGIIMVSYTDGIDTEPFIPFLKNDKLLREMIYLNLSKLFPNITIEEPEYIVHYYWTVGTHAWKIHSKKIYDEILNPIDNIYTCGEAYSKKQAWIEGALLMTNDVIKLNI